MKKDIGIYLLVFGIVLWAYHITKMVNRIDFEMDYLQEVSPSNILQDAIKNGDIKTVIQKVEVTGPNCVLKDLMVFAEPNEAAITLIDAYNATVIGGNYYMY